MDRLKVIYNGEGVEVIPFNKKDEVVLEFNNFLQSFIDCFTSAFELNIEIDGDAKTIIASSSSSERSYNATISCELAEDLISIIGYLLEEEGLIRPVESYICYNEKEVLDDIEDFNVSAEDNLLDDFDE